MDSLHEPVNTLARIWWWPPWGWILCDPKHVGVKWILHDFNVFLLNIVHVLVTIDNVFYRYTVQIWNLNHTDVWWEMTILKTDGDSAIAKTAVRGILFAYSGWILLFWLEIRSAGMHLCFQWWSFVFCIPAQKEPLSLGIASYFVPAIIWHISVDLSHAATHRRSVVNFPLHSALCCGVVTRTLEAVSHTTHISLFPLLSSHMIIFRSYQKHHILIWL